MLVLGNRLHYRWLLSIALSSLLSYGLSKTGLPWDKQVGAHAAVEIGHDPDHESASRKLGIVPEGGLVLRSTSLGQGGTLAGAMERLGVPQDAQSRAFAALRGKINLEALSSSTGLVVACDPSGSVRSLAVRGEPDRYLRVTSSAGVEPGVEIVDLPVVTRVETTGGIVRRSVAQALETTHHGFHLALAFADIFQWDVDLLVDPRPGDRIRVVYEIQELGGAPADLPPFGTAATRPGDFLGLGRILAASYEGETVSSNAYWVDGPDHNGGYYDDAGRPLRKAFLKSPLNYRRISSGFSLARRHPITRKVVPHHGVDFAAAAGTPVVAAADGRVVAAGWAGPLGRALRIRHGSDFVTVYGHLANLARGLRVGSDVRQGQVIGYVGSTGRATGPHLHYTLIHRGRPVDPMKQLANRAVEELPGALLPRLAHAKRTLSPLLVSIPFAELRAKRSTVRGDQA